MREPEELATAPDYRWRRWWNQFWIHCCVAVWLIVSFVSGDFIFMPAITTALFYWIVSRTVVQLDAAEQGHGPGLSDAVLAALERQRAGQPGPDRADEQVDLPSGMPVTGREPPATPPPAEHITPASFGQAKLPPRKPIDLPRRPR